MILGIALLCFVCAAIPAALFVYNLRLYVEPPLPTGALPAVSVLIPARNEAAAIGDAVRAVLSSRGADFEVVVMDDGSTDRTAEIVLALAAVDPRVRLEQAPALPGGWNGKQHACWALAHVARNPVLCFVDADVRLGPECVVRMAAFLEGKSLVSGFPQQITGTTLEWLLLPLIHFVLLGFLPVARMRASTDPAFAAGCGQFMMVRAADYFACGGHSGIKLTMHDGLRLPRLFREHGFQTDLADITHHATCRMYTSAGQVWSGLAKNATEGIADPKRIVPVSLILILGQVLPFVLLLWCITLAGLVACIASGSLNGPVSIANPAKWLTIAFLILAAAVAAWVPRLLSVSRFKQDWRSAILHPIGILTLLFIQLYALIRKLRGGTVSWRDRTYAKAEIA
jgi:glycosyltransferase involved in cell wall biosynthesis